MKPTSVRVRPRPLPAHTCAAHPIICVKIFCGGRAAKNRCCCRKFIRDGCCAQCAHTQHTAVYGAGDIGTENRLCIPFHALRTLPLLIGVKFIELHSKRELQNEGPSSGGCAGRHSKNIPIYVFSSLSLRLADHHRFILCCHLQHRPQ